VCSSDLPPGCPRARRGRRPRRAAARRGCAAAGRRKGGALAPRARRARPPATPAADGGWPSGRDARARLRRDPGPGRGGEREELMKPEDFVVVLVTAGDAGAAARIGRTLVGERPAAWANPAA